MAENHRGVTSIASIPSTVATALRRTMVLGMPVLASDRPTFYFDRVASWTEHDSADKPWDWSQAPDTEDTPTPVQPICAMEFHAPLGRSGTQYSEVGDFHPTTVIVTFLAQDFAEAYNAAYLTVGPEQTRFWFRYWKPAIALGGMAVYQAHFEAQDTA